MNGHALYAEPFRRFDEWFAAAGAQGSVLIPEPTAFSLASVGADGQPSLRILLLKGVDEGGFVFYTNHESRKGREILAHPQVAMCFHWMPLERQVRVEGVASVVSAAEADAYFASRPHGSQIGAWASRQSEQIEQAGELEKRVLEVEREFEGRSVTRPPHWSGFRVVPARMEFWRGMPSRLHERHVFVREGDGWRTEVLYP